MLDPRHRFASNVGVTPELVNDIGPQFGVGPGEPMLPGNSRLWEPDQDVGVQATPLTPQVYGALQVSRAVKVRTFPLANVAERDRFQDHHSLFCPAHVLDFRRRGAQLLRRLAFAQDPVEHFRVSCRCKAQIPLLLAARRTRSRRFRGCRSRLENYLVFIHRAFHLPR